MQNGHAEVVEVLCKAGADADWPTLNRWTPLALAAEVNAVQNNVMFAGNLLTRPSRFCLLPCRAGMLTWSRCCSQRVQLLTSLHLMVSYP